MNSSETNPVDTLTEKDVWFDVQTKTFRAGDLYMTKLEWELESTKNYQDNLGIVGRAIGEGVSSARGRDLILRAIIQLRGEARS